MAAFPDRPLIYVPAYPKLGRTVVDGRLYVDGVPLAETPFGEDQLSPSRQSSILELLGGDARVFLARDAGALADLLRERVAGSILVCDGSADEDLEAVASVLAAANRPCLVAGTGGFAGCWIRSLPVPRRKAACRPRVSRCLVVNGSLHPASREQVRQAGLPVFYPPPEPAAARALAEAIAAHRWALLSTPEQLAGSAAEAAARIGAVVQAVLQHAGIDGLVISGGDTARAVLTALRVSLVEPCGELLPGVPISVIGGRAPALITKAGGFGAPDTLARIRRILEEPA